MYRGWVGFYRKDLCEGFFKNRKLWQFWSYCLLKASHKEHVQMVGYQEVLLKPGELVFGREVAAKELAASVRSVRTCINYFRKIGKLTIKTTNKFSIISIINWEAYQDRPKQNDHQNDHQAAIKRPANDHKQQCKECINNVKKELFIETSHEVRLGKLLFSLILERDKTHKKPNFQMWGKDIDLMIRVDKRDVKEIEQVIYWCQGSSFWQNNILSPRKLRKQYDQLKLKMQAEKPQEIDYSRYP
jgi:hypothetical protein